MLNDHMHLSRILELFWSAGGRWKMKHGWLRESRMVLNWLWSLSSMLNEGRFMKGKKEEDFQSGLMENSKQNKRM